MQQVEEEGSQHPTIAGHWWHGHVHHDVPKEVTTRISPSCGTDQSTGPLHKVLFDTSGTVLLCPSSYHLGSTHGNAFASQDQLLVPNSAWPRTLDAVVDRQDVAVCQDVMELQEEARQVAASQVTSRATDQVQVVALVLLQVGLSVAGLGHDQ